MIIPNLIAPPSGRASAPDDPAFDYLARVAADSGQVLDASGLIQNVNRYKIPNAMGSDLFDKASIVIDANGGIKAGKVYALKPANAAADLDYVRASGVLLTGRDGNLIERAANVPAAQWSAARNRWELFPQSGATNLALRSQEFDNAYWVKNPIGINTAIGTDGIEPNVAIAPDDTMTADRVNFIPNGSVAGISRVFTAAAGSTHVVYIYVKGEGTDIGKTMSINMRRQIGDYVETNQQITLTAEWQRMAAPPLTFIDQTGLDLRFFSNSGQNGATSALIWGADLKPGHIVSSHIPSTDAIASRAADVCSKTGLTDYIGQTAGTLYAEINTRLTAGSARKVILSLSDGTAANRIELVKTATDQIQALITTASVEQAAIATAINQQGNFKIALGYAGNNVALYINGTQVGTDVLATIPACSVLHVGSSAAGEFFNDLIGPAMISKDRLSNDELAAATTL